MRPFASIMTAAAVTVNRDSESNTPHRLTHFGARRHKAAIVCFNILICADTSVRRLQSPVRLRLPAYHLSINASNDFPTGFPSIWQITIIFAQILPLIWSDCLEEFFARFCLECFSGVNLPHFSHESFGQRAREHKERPSKV